MWITGILSALGWWMGCIIAFEISRRGRKTLERLVSLEFLDEWTKKIPKDISFVGIILLRLVFPVDIPSFVLGLMPGINFWSYAIASFIGILPGAFLLGSAADHLVRGRFVAAGATVLVMVLLALVCRHWWKRIATK